MINCDISIVNYLMDKTIKYTQKFICIIDFINLLYNYYDREALIRLCKGFIVNFVHDKIPDGFFNSFKGDTKLINLLLENLKIRSNVDDIIYQYLYYIDVNIEEYEEKNSLNTKLIFRNIDNIIDFAFNNGVCVYDKCKLDKRHDFVFYQNLNALEIAFSFVCFKINIIYELKEELCVKLIKRGYRSSEQSIILMRKMQNEYDDFSAYLYCLACNNELDHGFNFIWFKQHDLSINYHFSCF